MSSVKKNFLYNSAYQILNMIIPLITTPYISRVLGPKGIGVYSYAYSIAYYFVLFVMLGLNNYGNRTIAGTRNDKQEMSKNFWNIYITQLILGIAAIIFYILYSFMFSDKPTISIILGLYVLSSAFDVNWFFYGMEKFKLTVIRNSLIKLSSLVAIFLFVKSDKDVFIYCFIMSMSFLLSQLVMWPFLLKEVVFVKPTWAEAKKHIKPNLLLFTTVIAVSLFKVMDKIMLGLMSEYSQVGFYESSEKVINIPIAFITALGSVMLPRMTHKVAKGGEQDIRIIRISLIFAMFMASSLCFGIMGVSDVFVPIFYGKGYDLCIILFMILLPSCIFLAFANVVRTQYLLPHKMDKAYITSAFLGAGVNMVINLLLIPQFAAIGAAIGTLIAEAVVCFYQCYKCRKQLPIGSFIVESLPMVLSGLIMFIILKTINITFLNGIALLSIKVLLGVFVYFITLILIMLIRKKQYQELLKSILKK
jgi:O-antigen/teichoic acid export membrane protein